MKFFIIFAVILAVTLADYKEKLREYSDACKSESGVSEESLTKVRNGENVDDPKLKEHGFCILKKAGFINASGDLQIETIKTKFTSASHNAEAVDKVIKKCAVQKSTPQETSAHFFTCLHEVKEKAKAH